MEGVFSGTDLAQATTPVKLPSGLAFRVLSSLLVIL